MDLSALFALWLIGGGNCYLMYMVVIAISNGVDASLPMKWNLVLIPRILKSVVNSVESRIIYLSLLFFIAVLRMVLQLCTYMA